jgi:hypothetical protein
LRRACQRQRSSHHNFSVFETVNGRPDLVDSAYFDGACQRIFVYASLFKFDAVVGQPTHNPIRILLYFRFFTIWHLGLLFCASIGVARVNNSRRTYRFRPGSYLVIQ